MQQEKQKGASFARFGLILGLLAALGPIAIDLYLPGLPRLVQDLATGEGPGQLTVMGFFVGLAAAQLVYGPLSDKFGRKPPIYLGLALFVFSSIACAAVTSIDQLIFFRFLQGAGGAIGMVIGMAVVRDLYTGAQAARLIAFIILVLGVSPILAPLAGSLIMMVASWRVVFLVNAAFGLACLAAVWFGLPETRPAEVRRGVRLADTFKTYGRLMRNGRFMTMVLMPGIIQAGFFAYIAGSAFAFIGVHHLSPFGYSLVFSLNSVGIIGATQLTPLLLLRFGVRPLITVAVIAHAAATILLCALVLLQLDTLPALIALLFVAVTCFGLIVPPSNVAALEPMGAVAGTASALMGTLQFGCGVLGSAAVGLFANGTLLPMALVLGVCGVLALAVSAVVIGRYLPAPAAA